MSASPDSHPNPVSTAYAAIALALFFAIGLAGGTAYKLLAAPDDSDQRAADAPAQIADVAPVPGAPVPDFALPYLTPTAPPALAPPPAPTSLPPHILVTPAAPADTGAQAASAAPSQVSDAAAIPPPPHAAAPHRAPPPKKPRAIAKDAPTAPHEPAIVLHAPPRAPENVSGPFRVQFGAFANEENAHRVRWAVEATGIQVEVTQAPGGTTGELLYYLRSPRYPDYASALSAAQTVQDRVRHFVNAIPIDYAILGDRNGIQQASAR